MRGMLLYAVRFLGRALTSGGNVCIDKGIGAGGGNVCGSEQGRLTLPG